MTDGTAAYSLGTDVIDILSAVVRRSSVDYALSVSVETLTRTSRQKAQKVGPSQFFLDRQITPSLKVWPTPENSTDVIYYNALTRMDDADSATNTLEVPFRFYPCLAAGFGLLYLHEAGSGEDPAL